MKLGYGGTKEEMQRLLDDASKLPAAMGKKFDLSNYADVVEAIHLVQQDMEISGISIQEYNELVSSGAMSQEEAFKLLGTTAKEASTTISGSAASMKSAWKNMLVGIADGNADFSGLIDNLVNSVSTFSGNLLPVVQQALSGVGRLVAELAPTITAALPELFNSILPGLLEAALGIITSLADALPNMLVTISTTIATFVAENAPALLQAGISLVVNLAQGIAESLPTLIPVAIDAVMALFTTLTDPSNLGMMVDAAIQLTFSLATGLIDAIPTLIEKAPEIVASVMQAIIENAPKLLEASLALVVKLAEGIVSNLPKMVESAKKVVKSFVDGIKNLMSSVRDIGKNIVDGVWHGIKNAAATFTANVKNFFKNIVDSVKSALGIHSPSRIFRDEVGKMMAAGIGVGFADEMDNVRRDVLNEVDGLTGNVGTINAGFEASINSAPIAATDNGMSGVAQRIIDAINNRETSVKVFLDSKEIRAGQERLSRAMG